MLIALSGYARSGKNTAAQFLVDDRGYKDIAFADVLRECVMALDPIVDSSGLRYKQALLEFGYEESKVLFPEVRSVLQRMGTEVGRNILGENIWVELTMGKIMDDPAQKNWVITDCRYPNEYNAVNMAGGANVRIVRPGYQPANEHASERALDEHDFDAWIINDGSIEALMEEVMCTVDEVEGV